MGSNRNKKLVQVGRFFKGLLPEGYAQQQAQIQQFQHFFEAQESDAVFQMVKVTNVTDNYLNITLPNAALSSYLRLHSEQIRQLIQHNFGMELVLKISTSPESFNQPEQLNKKTLLADISQFSCDQMKTAADYVEDDNLKRALKSLSVTLSHKHK